MRILFLLKYRQGYGDYGDSNCYFSSGLYWSAKFVVDMLKDRGVEAKFVEIVDNNQIDREVSLFKPDTVIIEALWVVPSKFDVLKKLYPRISWIVRLHSNVPFLANEGVAIEWIKGYKDRGVLIATNSKQASKDFNALYLPNFYPISNKTHPPTHREEYVNISCHGAIRPLKNQLAQAMSAIKFADSVGKRLHFFINNTRIESGGNPVLENIRSLFQHTKHQLIENTWLSHREFLNLLKFMDVGMQVSLSETFSIVAADIVSVGVPLVASPEVKWASFVSKTNPYDIEDICHGISRAYNHSHINTFLNRFNLEEASSKAVEVWMDFIYG